MRIFSGIQPTGRKHLGNYIGAITQYVAGQERGEGIYCVVDLHATTVAYEPAGLREAVHHTTAVLDRIDEIVPPGVNVSPADRGWDPPSLTDPSLRRRAPA